jgi:phage terminase large subunit-like protein
VALLFDQGKAMLAGVFPKLEDQLCSFTTAGYMGDRSPDRADAMVWALSEVFPAIARDRQKIKVVHESASKYSVHAGAYPNR